MWPEVNWFLLCQHMSLQCDRSRCPPFTSTRYLVLVPGQKCVHWGYGVYICESNSQHWFTTSFLSLEKGACRKAGFLFFWGESVYERACSFVCLSVCVSARKRMMDLELSWTEFDCTTYSMYQSSPVRFIFHPCCLVHGPVLLSFLLATSVNRTSGYIVRYCVVEVSLFPRRPVWLSGTFLSVTQVYLLQLLHLFCVLLLLFVTEARICFPSLPIECCCF